MVAKTDDQWRPAFKPTVATFILTKPTDLVLQAANFNSQGGGAWSTIYIGNESIIRDFVMQQTGLDIFLFGAIGIIALYHFALFYLGRSDRSTLLFGILCSMIAVRTLVTGQLFLIQLIPDIPFEFYRRLEFLSFFLSLPSFVHFIALVFYEDFKKYEVMVVWSVSGFVSFITLFTNSAFYMKLLMPFQLFTLFVILFIIYRMIIVMRNKRDGSMILFFGAIILAGFVVNDFLHNWGVIRTGYYTPIGLLVFLFSQAIFLSMRFSKAFLNVEELSQNLLITNEGYSRFVPRDFLEQLGYTDITQVQLGDQVQRDMTILFADIRSFTSLSERMTPDENFKFLNSYLKRMADY